MMSIFLEHSIEYSRYVSGRIKHKGPKDPKRPQDILLNHQNGRSGVSLVGQGSRNGQMVGIVRCPHEVMSERIYHWAD